MLVLNIPYFIDQGVVINKWIDNLVLALNLYVHVFLFILKCAQANLFTFTKAFILWKFTDLFAYTSELKVFILYLSWILSECAGSCLSVLLITIDNWEFSFQVDGPAGSRVSPQESLRSQYKPNIQVKNLNI